MNWKCTCGREVPLDRECPACYRISRLWYGLVFLVGIGGAVWIYRMLH